MRLAKFFEILLRRKRTILGCLTSAVLVAVVGNYLVIPQYRTHSKVFISQPGEQQIGETGVAKGSVAAILSSDGIEDLDKIVAAPNAYVEEVISRLQLRDKQNNLLTADRMVDPSLWERASNLFWPVPYVRLERGGDAEILKIMSVSPRPRQARMMADCMAEVVVSNTRKRINDRFESAQRTVSRQLADIREQYTSSLRAIAEFQKRQESVDVDTEVELAAKKMGQLLKQKEETHILLAETRTQLEQLRKKMGQEKQEALALSALKDNPHVNAIKEKLTILRLELAEIASDFTDQHPRMQALREQIRVAERELQAELTLYRSGAPEIADLEGKILALGARMNAIDENIHRHSRFLSDLPDKAFKQASFNIELEAGPEAYSALLDSRHTLQMAEVGCLSGVKLMEKAEIPASPFFPNKGVNTAVGVLFGLMVGLGLALAREYLDDTIKSADDVKALRPAATVGAIPLIESKNLALIAGRDANDPLYESYRWIRSHFDLIEHIRNKRIQSLLIFSPGPNEGKSTTVVNLGISVAREGKKVILVDADLRRPSLDRYLNVPNEKGLSTWLEGKCRLDEIICSTSITGLDAIFSGEPVSDPGRLLELRRMGDLISKLQSKYDLVILDSAPLLIKADALALARWVQGSVIVLESEKTTRRALCDMMDRVAVVPAKPLGFVLNKCPTRKGVYSDRYYSYAYLNQAHTRPMVKTPQEKVVEL